MRPAAVLALASVLPLLCFSSAPLLAQDRPRARSLGVAPGIFRPGPWNAITDVAGVRVGQVTIVEGDDVRTGVTAILPHDGNPYVERVPAALHVGNGFGKFLGVTQVRELGELETPILLTCTLCVWKAADAMTEWMLARDGMAGVGSINPVVGETNDGGLNAIRRRPIRPEHVRRHWTKRRAARWPRGRWAQGRGRSPSAGRAASGPRRASSLPRSADGPSGCSSSPTSAACCRCWERRSARSWASTPSRASGPRARRRLDHDRRRHRRPAVGPQPRAACGPRDHGPRAYRLVGIQRQRRLRPRLLDGPGGSPERARLRRDGARRVSRTVADLANDDTSALFQAVVEATEEAIYNSMFTATTVTGNGRTVEALPLDKVRAILRTYGIAAR